jgi:hypothetical protein
MVNDDDRVRRLGFGESATDDNDSSAPTDADAETSSDAAETSCLGFGIGGAEVAEEIPASRLLRCFDLS